MSDQGQGQSEPSTREQISALLSPPEPEQTIEPPEIPAETTADPQAPETQAEAPEADPTAGWEEVEVNGVRVQVPPEVAKGVMQEKDYTQKSQALADERRALAAREQSVQIQQQAVQYVQPLIAKGQQLDAMLQDFQKIDWQTLQMNDPLQYATKRADQAALYQERQALIQNFEQAKQYIGQQRQQAMAQAAQAAAPILKRAIPDWGPEKDMALTKYALGAGAPAEDLMGLATKPWAVVALEKARKYDELQASRAQLPKKVQGLSPVAKPGAKSTVEASGQASYRNAMEQLKKSGGKDKGALRALIKAKTS